MCHMTSFGELERAEGAFLRAVGKSSKKPQLTQNNIWISAKVLDAIVWVTENIGSDVEDLVNTSQYEDEKIRIIIDWQALEIAVFVKLVDEENSETVVLRVGNMYDDIYRPGLWEKYVSVNLVGKANESVYGKKSRLWPIDDRKVFEPTWWAKVFRKNN